MNLSRLAFRPEPALAGAGREPEPPEPPLAGAAPGRSRPEPEPPSAGAALSRSRPRPEPPLAGAALSQSRPLAGAALSAALSRRPYTPACMQGEIVSVGLYLHSGADGMQNKAP